ncbi:lysylphosphatidylglycerol synthase transmembrane domain-containing protein [Chromohalobacter sp. HP20-39]|uniref:lysylphosphatidylglycerol synthase transmembrane domain-containing protein n=1 Tax=Chromohalobacter sp. HP20-39 TaxID=3079306 RepID=UPI00294B2E27|nr:lysylphosphatidylglycerol synthase transmembrane domain-containing protein [Chromohalobacter sp. HP20-39]MDV6319613.1 lysylphosphatidylglycerol synthase transmembrane domain-containing protein [Chromohalobacter sp. HP20-39]
MKRLVILLVIGLAAAISIPLLFGGRALFGELAAFPLQQLAFMLLLIVICWNINALRLRLLLAGRAGRLGQTRAVGIVMSTEFAICATPGGTGGLLTLLALLARRGVRPAQTTAIFAVDQLTDLLFFLSALIGVALYVVIEAIDLKLGWMVGLPSLLLVCAFLLLWLIIRHYTRVLQVTGGWLERLNVRRKARFGLARRLLHFRNALIETLRLPRLTLLAVFALCCAHWMLRYSVLYLAVKGLGAHIDWAWTFLVQMVSMAAGQLSFLPGGAGGAELTSTALLTPLIGTQSAAAAVLIWRFVTYYFYLIAGAPVFLAMAGRTFARLLSRR